MSTVELIWSVVATISLCEKQAISLRGHCDDWSDLLGSDEESCTQGGDFHGPLQFSNDAGDKI